MDIFSQTQKQVEFVNAWGSRENWMRFCRENGSKSCEPGRRFQKCPIALGNKSNKYTNGDMEKDDVIYIYIYIYPTYLRIY